MAGRATRRLGYGDGPRWPGGPAPQEAPGRHAHDGPHPVATAARRGDGVNLHTPPGVLVADLLGGDGPYLAAAEAFLACRCACCGRGVERTAVQHDDRYFCPTCWADTGGGAGAR